MQRLYFRHRGIMQSPCVEQVAALNFRPTSASGRELRLLMSNTNQGCTSYTSSLKGSGGLSWIVPSLSEL